MGQQQMHQMNKFPTGSHSSGAYPGPPSVIRGPGFTSIRSGPPPQTSSGGSLLGSASTGSAPGQPSHIKSAGPVPTTVSSAYGMASNEKANSQVSSTNSTESKGSSSSSNSTETEASRSAAAAAGSSTSDSVDKESTSKVEPATTK